MRDYRSIIERLNLLPHPEGGYYRRYRQSVLQAKARDTSGTILHALYSCFLGHPYKVWSRTDNPFCKLKRAIPAALSCMLCTAVFWDNLTRCGIAPAEASATYVHLC